MRAGGIRRRCRCRDSNGRDLGAKCPKLTQRSHGKWKVRQELPAAKDGTRRTFRREGYDLRDDAQKDLDRVREILNLAEEMDEPDDLDLVAEMLLSLDRDEKLPEVESVKLKLKTGQPLNDKGTIGDWLDEWFKQEKGKHRPNTEVSYESHIRLYLKPKIGHIRRDRLTVGHCIEMFNSIEDDNDLIQANNDDRRALQAQVKATSNRSQKRALRDKLAELPPFRRPVGPTSQQRIRATLRAALNDAIIQQKLTFNPAAHVEIPGKKPKPLLWTPERVEEWERTGVRPGPVMVWLPEHAGMFLDYVAEHDPDNEAMWQLMVYRGPRRGEVAGLGWTEVPKDARSIEITTQLVEVQYRVEEGAPKSDCGERTILLDDGTSILLRAHRKRQSERRLKLGDAWVASGRVFTKADGSALRPSWIGDQFERLCRAAGLPPIRLHDLRHVAATLMLAAKIDMKVIQEILGHSVLSTTADLYTSVLPQLGQEAADKTAAIVPRRAPAKTLGHPSGTQEAVSQEGLVCIS